MTDDEFLLAFEECTLSREEWTHEAHVRMAWAYLTRSCSCRAARNKIRDGIKKLNAAFIAQRAWSCITVRDRPRDPRGLDGYHETITMAFVRLIAVCIQPGEDFPAFRSRNPHLFDRALPALLKHYSPGRLYSEEAKKQFVQPDREPLPKI